MNGLYRLLNFEFSKWLKVLLPLAVGLILIPPLLMRSAVKGYNEYAVHHRFESLYISSGGAAIFGGCFLLLCLFFLIRFYAQYWGGKSAYTFLTLPVSRDAIYWSRLIVFLGSMLLLVAANWLGIKLSYSAYATHIGQYADGQYVMDNGYFLALIRSEFFRLIMPLTFSRILSSFAIMLTIAVCIYYIVLCERSRYKWFIVTVNLPIWLMMRTLLYDRLDERYQWNAQSGLYFSSLVLIGISGLYIAHSIWMLRRGTTV